MNALQPQSLMKSDSTQHAADTSVTTIDHRYQLNRPLAVGGMAEIFLAEQSNREGFRKNVVIKRLKQDLAGDTRVVSMFRDEAKISAQLSHGNTVHVFDSGTHQGVPYIAMQYIHGQELNELCRRGISCGEFLPLEHAIELVRQAALGLGYLHNLRDSNGDLLDLVHCDISPNNLLIGDDGYLQIIDFGISQFRGQQYRDAKLVPGKLSYMSPEQAHRDALDHRTDIFSLGVVLYEITLGKRLFRGSANEVLPRLLAGDIKPPTFVRHDYPGALESIVMRALEAKPTDRYQEAYEFADALGNYLREENANTGPIAIARYLDRLRVAEGGERREEFIAESEVQEEPLDFDSARFQGFSSMSPEESKALACWDEFEEEESELAAALGIDVELVRTASRASPSPPHAEVESAAPEPAKTSAVEEPAPQSVQPIAPKIGAIERLSLPIALIIAMGLGIVIGSVVSSL